MIDLDRPVELLQDTRYGIYKPYRVGAIYKYDHLRRVSLPGGECPDMRVLMKFNPLAVVEDIGKFYDQHVELHCGYIGNSLIGVQRVKVGDFFISYRNFCHFAEFFGFITQDPEASSELSKVRGIMQILKLSEVRLLPESASFVNYLEFVE